MTNATAATFNRRRCRHALLRPVEPRGQARHPLRRGPRLDLRLLRRHRSHQLEAPLAAMASRKKFLKSVIAFQLFQ